MAIYNINTGPLYTDYGALPSPKKRGNLAITGVFDFPKRDGTTEKNWGDTIEAFLDAEDINFKPKQCNLYLYLEGTNKTDYNTNLNALLSALKNATSITTDYGLDVEIKSTGKITVSEYLSMNSAYIQYTFEMPNGVLEVATQAASGGNGYKIDNYNLFEDFGLIVKSRSDNKSIAKYNNQDTTTAYEQDLSQRQPKVISLDVTMQASSPYYFLNQISRLHQLLASPDSKTLTFPDGENLEVYCRDGFKINDVQTLGKTTAQFYLKLREII